MKHFKLFFLLCSLTFYTDGYGQFEVNELSQEDWPIESQRSNFLKAADGYIWFFVDGSLCRYDGREVNRYGLAKNSDNFFATTLVSLVETNNGLAFEVNGFFYYFNNGVFRRLNQIQFEELRVPIGKSISPDLDMFWNGRIYYYKNGGIHLDSLKGSYAYMEMRPDHEGVYRSITHDKMFYLKNHQVDSMDIDLMPTQGEGEGFDFWTDYRCYNIDGNRQLFHSSFSDTVYIYKDKNVELKIPVDPINRHYLPQDIFPVIWLVDPNNYRAPIFWSKGSEYSFYHNGMLIKNDSVFTFNECKDYAPKYFNSGEEVLFIDNGDLVNVNLVKRTKDYVDGIQELRLGQRAFSNQFDTDEYLFLSKSSLKHLKSSRVERININLFKYKKSGAHFSGANGYLDTKGNWYGQILNENSLESSIAKTVGNELNLLVSSSGDSLSISGVPEAGYLLKYFNDGEVLLFDNLEAYFSPDFSATNTCRLVQGTQEIVVESGSHHFMEINGSIYTFDEKRERLIKANFSNLKMEESELQLPGFRIPKGSTSEFLYTYEFAAGPDGSTTMNFFWTKINDDSVSDSLEFACESNKLLVKVIDKDRVFINKRGFADSVYVVSFSAKTVEKYQLKSRIYDDNKYSGSREYANDELVGRLWMKSRNGITEFDFSNGLETTEISTPFTNKEVEAIQLVQDSILLVTTHNMLFGANVSRGRSSLASKILMTLPSDNYEAIFELNDGRVCLGKSKWNEYMILPENFFTTPLYDKPEIHLKSLSVADKYLYGLHPTFDSLNVVELKNEFTSDENDIHFKFTTLDFRNYDFMSYRYQLAGWEEGWHYTDKPEVKFNNLPEGEYTLTFQSRYMQRFSEPFVYSFTINPPWYKTSWAYTGYILSLIFLIWLLLKLRTKQLLKKQVVLEHKIDKATVEIKKQKEDAEHQRDLVEEKNQEILDSITYAKRLQNAILPPPRLVKEWLNDSFIFYKPKDIVAGDFYWMETTKRNGRNVIFYAAADCTGHGVPGAMVSVVCSNALNRAIKEFGISDPGELLDKVAEIVQESFSKSEDTVKDGMDIAVCAVDLIDRKLWFAGAHNGLYRITDEDTKIPEGLKVLEAGNRKLVEYKADKQPVGAFEHMEPFNTVEIQLEPGDCIYLFSDGFADQFGGDKGKKFKYKPFKQLLLDVESKDMDSQKDILDVEFERWRGTLEQVDDVCIIGLRVNGHMRKLFSQRELEVIAKIKDGLRSKEIADELNIAKSTVDSHRKRILAKTNLNSVVELMKFCSDHEVL